MASRILLADDSITIQKVVNLTFADEGIDVVTVSNGEMAQRRLAEVNPDLVLADIFMPGKNGYELCQYIKESPQFRTVPVVLLVGAFEPFDQAEARRVSADGHLTKPFESRTLVETVRKLIQERKSASGQLRHAQQAQSASSVPDTRPLTTQPLEAPFNIDLSPIEDAGLSSGFGFADVDSAAPQQPDAAMPEISPFGEPFRLDYGSAWHPDSVVEPNGSNGQQSAAGKSDRVTADLAPAPGASDSFGFDFTQVDQPEPPLPADSLSTDLFHSDQPAQQPKSSSDFSSFKAEDELLTMELSQVKTGPLEASAIHTDHTSLGAEWNPAAAPAADHVTPVRDFEPAQPAVAIPTTSTTAPAHSFLGEDEPLGDVLSERSSEESIPVLPSPVDAHAYEAGIWSAPVAPAPRAEDITLDFTPSEDPLVDSGAVSSLSNQVPLSNLGPGDFLIGSDEVRGTGAATLGFSDVIASTHEEDAASLPFQPLSIAPEAASTEQTLPERTSGEPHKDTHEGMAFANLSEFRASEMWAPEQAQFAAIDIEAIPVPEEAERPALVAEQVEEHFPVSQPIELPTTTQVSESVDLTSATQISEPIDLTSEAHVIEPVGPASTAYVTEPIDLASTAHVSEPLDLDSTAHVSEPLDLDSMAPVSEHVDLISTAPTSEHVDLLSTTSASEPIDLISAAPVRESVEPTPTVNEASKTGFEVAVPASAVLPEIGFDIVLPAAEAVVAQPDNSYPAQADIAAAALTPTSSEFELGAKPADDASIANISASAVEEIVRRVLQEMSDSVVREIAWEVVPDCVERVVAATVDRLARESLAKRG